MSKELEVAMKAAKAASKILLENFQKGISAKRKSIQELVTEADLKSEAKIIEILQKSFPDYAIWSEEAGDLEQKNDCRWIIDPLDGTHNFFCGIPIFGISIALAVEGKIQCGVIHLPVFNELYTVERGKGAFMNGKPITVSKRPMEDASINICEHFIKSGTGIEKLREIMSKILAPRRFGSAVFSFACIASGRIDAIIESEEKIGDFAAGWLLVEEAGGKITTLSGGKFSLDHSSYLASSGVFHKELIKIMGGGE